MHLMPSIGLVLMAIKEVRLIILPFLRIWSYKESNISFDTMTREDPSASGQPLCRDRGNVVSTNRVDAERSVNNVRLQRGEESSSEFLRDRVAVRRITVMNDGKYLQTIQAGVNINQNHQVVCGDLNGIVELRRMDNEGNANALDFAGTFRERVLSDSRLRVHDNSSTHHLEEGIIYQSPRNIGRAKSPSVVSSSSRGSSMHWQDVIDEKHQGTTCQNQPLFKMLESCNDNFKTIQEIKAMNGNPASSDPHWKHLIGNKEVTPNNKAIENKITTNPAVIFPYEIQRTQEAHFSLYK